MNRGTMEHSKSVYFRSSGLYYLLFVLLPYLLFLLIIFVFFYERALIPDRDFYHFKWTYQELLSFWIPAGYELSCLPLSIILMMLLGKLFGFGDTSKIYVSSIYGTKWGWVYIAYASILSIVLIVIHCATHYMLGTTILSIVALLVYIQNKFIIGYIKVLPAKDDEYKLSNQ